MFKAYKAYWQGYVDFKGRTTAGGYWLAFLANWIASFVLSIFGTLLNASRSGGAASTVVIATFMLLCLLPSLAIAVRRLRDAGCSWANMFWALLPMVGTIILIVKLCKPSKDGAYKPIAQQSGASGAPVYQTYAAPAATQAPAPANPAANPAPPAAPSAASPAPSAGSSILDQYRAALSYLDSCGTFDEAKFREFNRVSGNRFSEGDVQTQLSNAKMMLGGMEELRKVLRSTMAEGVRTFEELERNGIDLSKYKL